MLNKIDWLILICSLTVFGLLIAIPLEVCPETPIMCGDAVVFSLFIGALQLITCLTYIMSIRDDD